MTPIKVKTLYRSSIARRGEEGRYDSFSTPLEYNRENLILGRKLIRETQPRGSYGEWRSMFEHIFHQVNLKTVERTTSFKRLFKDFNLGS